MKHGISSKGQERTKWEAENWYVDFNPQYKINRCYIRTVTIPRPVTIQLQPFLRYMILALKNS